MDASDSEGASHAATRGFFPLVYGTDVHVERSGGVAFVAGRDLSVERGGGQWFLSAGNVSIHQGGGVAVVARTVRLERGIVGVLVARNVHVASGGRVLLRLAPAVPIALAAGFVVGWLLRAARSKP